MASNAMKSAWAPINACPFTLGSSVLSLGLEWTERTPPFRYLSNSNRPPDPPTSSGAKTLRRHIQDRNLFIPRINRRCRRFNVRLKFIPFDSLFGFAVLAFWEIDHDQMSLGDVSGFDGEGEGAVQALC